MLVIRPERVNKNENFMKVYENIFLTDVISPALELISGLMKRSLWQKCMWLVQLQNRTCNRSQIFCFGWSGPVLNSDLLKYFAGSPSRQPANAACLRGPEISQAWVKIPGVCRSPLNPRHLSKKALYICFFLRVMSVWAGRGWFVWPSG